jgi:hypothetical protein
MKRGYYITYDWSDKRFNVHREYSTDDYSRGGADLLGSFKHFADAEAAILCETSGGLSYKADNGERTPSGA